MILVRTTLINTLFVGLLALSGCGFALVGQEIELTHDWAADTLELTIVSVGLHVTDENKLDEHAGSVLAALAGRRRLWIPEWSIHWDLDSEPAPDDDPEILALAEAFTLIDVGAYLDEEGRLCAVQTFSIQPVSRSVDRLNRRFSSFVLDEAEEKWRGDAAERDGPFDARSRELWEHAARSGHRWFELSSGVLTVRLPLTAEASWRLRDEWVEARRGRVDASLARLAQHLVYVSHFSIEPEMLEIELAPPPDGVYRFRFVNDAAEYDPRLLEALEAKGVELEQR